MTLTFFWLLLSRLFPRFTFARSVLETQRRDQERAEYWRQYGRHVEHAKSAAGITSKHGVSQARAECVAKYYWRGYQSGRLLLEHAITGMRDAISRINPSQPAQSEGYVSETTLNRIRDVYGIKSGAAQ